MFPTFRDKLLPISNDWYNSLPNSDEKGKYKFQLSGKVTALVRIDVVVIVGSSSTSVGTRYNGPDPVEYGGTVVIGTGNRILLRFR